MFNARRLLVVLALVAGSLAVMAATASALVTTDNLIVNGDAEAALGGTGAKVPVPGWVRSGFSVSPGCNTATKAATVVRYGSPGGFPDFGTPGPADHAFNFFAGGPNCGINKSWLMQCIDVSAHAHSINAGLVTYDAGGWFGGFKNQNDRARLWVITMASSDCSGDGAAATGFNIAGPVRAIDRAGITGLLPRTISGDVPHLTLSVLVILQFDRSTGSYNDGYSDSNWLTLTVHS